MVKLVSPAIAEEYPEITAGCNVYKPSGIANIYYDEMAEQGCAYYIALTSLGYDGDYTPRDLGQESPWINLILDSSTGTVLDMGEVVGQTNVIAFNLQPGFEEVGKYDVHVNLSEGRITTLPTIYTAEGVQNYKANKTIEELIASPYTEPGEDAQPAADGNGTVTITGGTRNNMAVYMLCLAGIILLTIAIIIVMSRKSSGKNKQK